MIVGWLGRGGVDTAEWVQGLTRREVTDGGLHAAGGQLCVVVLAWVRVRGCAGASTLGHGFRSALRPRSGLGDEALVGGCGAEEFLTGPGEELARHGGAHRETVEFVSGPGGARRGHHVYLGFGCPGRCHRGWYLEGADGGQDAGGGHPRGLTVHEGGDGVWGVLDRWCGWEGF